MTAPENKANGHSGPAEQVADDDLLARLQSATQSEDKPPVLSTSDVADLLPIGREATRRRLNDLKEEGRVRTYKAGRNPVWWPSDGEEGGEINPEGIRPDDIDHLSGEQIKALIEPSEIPKDFAQRIAGEKLENYSEDTKWESMSNFGSTLVTIGFTIVVGIFIIEISDYPILSNVLDDVVMLAIFLAMGGLPFWLGGKMMGGLAERTRIPHNRWPNIEDVKISILDVKDQIKFWE